MRPCLSRVPRPALGDALRPDRPAAGSETPCGARLLRAGRRLGRVESCSEEVVVARVACPQPTPCGWAVKPVVERKGLLASAGSACTRLLTRKLDATRP